MKKIQLSQGKFALVDDCDYEWLSQWKWFYDGSGYACRWRRKEGTEGTKWIQMHREVCRYHGTLDGSVDHANYNRVDNQLKNLRPATKSQNAANQKPRVSSKFKGVRLLRNRWHARIRADTREIYLGSFDNAEEAALAYNKAAKKYFGDFARLNEL